MVIIMSSGAMSTIYINWEGIIFVVPLKSQSRFVMGDYKGGRFWIAWWEGGGVLKYIVMSKVCLVKRYFIIEETIARHFVQYSECASQIIRYGSLGNL